MRCCRAAAMSGAEHAVLLDRRGRASRAQRDAGPRSRRRRAALRSAARRRAAAAGTTRRAARRRRFRAARSRIARRRPRARSAEDLVRVDPPAIAERRWPGSSDHRQHRRRGHGPRVRERRRPCCTRRSSRVRRRTRRVATASTSTRRTQRVSFSATNRCVGSGESTMRCARDQFRLFGQLIQPLARRLRAARRGIDAASRRRRHSPVAGKLPAGGRALPLDARDRPLGDHPHARAARRSRVRIV